MTTVGAADLPPQAIAVRAAVPLLRKKRRRVDLGGAIGGSFLLVIAVACLLASFLAPLDPTRVDLAAGFQGPNLAHIFGTDYLGRDLWARVLHGGRLSLGVAAVATAVSLAISLLLGVPAAYVGGAADGLVMRLVDFTLAFPRLILAIAVAGLLGAGLWSVVAAIIVSSWAWHARVVRGMVLQLREEPYILAAHALGASALWLLARHLLPALAGRVAVLVSLDFGQLILNVSALSFLGLGAQPPTPEWGAMLSEGRLFFTQAPELMVYPGLAIFVSVLAANLIGDAVRDRFDPGTER